MEIKRKIVKHKSKTLKSKNITHNNVKIINKSITIKILLLHQNQINHIIYSLIVKCNAIRRRVLSCSLQRSTKLGRFRE